MKKCMPIFDLICVTNVDMGLLLSEFILSQHQSRCTGKFQKKQLQNNFQSNRRKAAIWKRVEEFHKRRLQNCLAGPDGLSDLSTALSNLSE